MNLVNPFKPRLFKGNIKVWRLLKLGKFQVELCVFPRGTQVKWHKHDLSDVQVMHIYGNAFYSRCNPETPNIALQTGEGLINNKHCYVTTFGKDGAFLRRFTIPASYWHMATVGGKPLITLSIQHWRKKTLLITEDFTEPKL